MVTGPLPLADLRTAGPELGLLCRDLCSSYALKWRGCALYCHADVFIQPCVCMA
jgi:hypothetical protein